MKRLLRIALVSGAVAGAALGAGGGLLAVAGPASAAMKPVYPNVSVDDTHGVLTTPCVVHAGEELRGVGAVTGTFVITAVHADGPVSRVTIPGLPLKGSNVFDFISVGPPS